MYIALTAIGPNLDDLLAVRFGRGPYLFIVDPESGACQVRENPCLSLRGGNSQRLLQFLREHNISVALTGDEGHNYRDLHAAGICTQSVPAGTVRAALAEFAAVPAAC